MNFFKRSKVTKIVDDTESIVADFKLRAPFWSYRTVPYREYEPFVNFTADIDNYLERLFEGEIDDGNGNVLDNIICDMARQAEEHLKRQHTEHRDTIKSFDIRNKGDKTAFMNERILLQAEIEDTEQQIEEVKRRMKRDKFVGGEKHA